MKIPTRLAEIPAIAPQEPAIQFKGTWRTWDYLLQGSASVAKLLEDSGRGATTRVGVLMRNRPEIAAAVVGLLSRECCVLTLSTAIPTSELLDELRRLTPPLVIASDVDLAADGGPTLIEGCVRLGIQLVSVSDQAGLAPCEVVGDLDNRPPRTTGDDCAPGVAVEMLTSGTTGRPKRVDLRYRSLEIEAESTARYRGGGQGDGGPRLSSGVTILWASLLHIAGVRALIESVMAGRRVALMERFDVTEWQLLMKEHRPKAVFLVPATLQMILDARVSRDVFDGVIAVFSGSAPLDSERASEFSERYGLPVLQIYGATEFAGGVAGWTLKDWKEFGSTKGNSVGRANAGIELRIVDPESGSVLPETQPGVLEVRGPQLASDGWVRTTDIAEIDADGFLYILGRTDDVIIRGGLKVHAGEVAVVLRGHPAVRDAVVVAAADRRLGAVPIAAVELESGAETDRAELTAFLRERLPAYQLPTRIQIFHVLPRTPSLKISQPMVRTMLGVDPDSSV